MRRWRDARDGLAEVLVEELLRVALVVGRVVGVDVAHQHIESGPLLSRLKAVTRERNLRRNRDTVDGEHCDLHWRHAPCIVPRHKQLMDLEC